jgi:glycosyltransferase involved in cell wall biosynthesis
MQRHDVDVVMLARHPHISTYTNTVAETHVGQQPIKDIAKLLKPDIIHFHWLSMPSPMVAWDYLAEIPELNVPVTIRGHSFDFNRDTVRKLAAQPNVRQIWLFPHFAAEVFHPKIAPLTSCFDNSLYYPNPAPTSATHQVFRTGAGLPGKGIEGFIAAARKCPDMKFVLAITRSLPPDDIFPDVIGRNMPDNIEYHISIQREKVIELMRASSVFFAGYGHHNQFAMSVSIVEALACGLLVIAPDVPAARSYIKDAGLFYDATDTPGAKYHGSIDDAVRLLKSTLTWPETTWDLSRKKAAAVAALYTTDNVLPAVLRKWESIVAQKSTCL